MNKLKFTIIDKDEAAGDVTYLLCRDEEGYHFVTEEFLKGIEISVPENMDEIKSFANTLQENLEQNDKFKRIAIYFFKFLWDSENGVSTGCDKDVFEDDFEGTDITWEDCESFVEWINTRFSKDGIWQDEDECIEIGWDYLTYFNEHYVFTKGGE